MSIREFMSAFFFASSLLIADCCDAQTESECRFVARGFNYPDGVSDFFQDMTFEKIRQLKFHSNPKISLYAAWIECELTCIKIGKINPAESHVERDRFLNFLSGRLNSPVPRWWGRVVQTNSVFCFANDEKKDFIETNGVNHLNNFELISLSEKLIVVKQGDRETSIKWDRTDYWNNGAFGLEKDLRCIAIKPVSAERIVYANSDDFGIMLGCTSPDGENLWLKRSGSQSGLNSFLSPQTNYVEIVISNETLSLFSANLSHEAFVGSYSLSTGETICEFTTKFSFKWEKFLEEKMIQNGEKPR